MVINFINENGFSYTSSGSRNFYTSVFNLHVRDSSNQICEFVREVGDVKIINGSKYRNSLELRIHKYSPYNVSQWEDISVDYSWEGYGIRIINNEKNKYEYSRYEGQRYWINDVLYFVKLNNTEVIIDQIIVKYFDEGIVDLYIINNNLNNTINTLNDKKNSPNKSDEIYLDKFVMIYDGLKNRIYILRNKFSSSNVIFFKTRRNIYLQYFESSNIVFKLNLYRDCKYTLRDGYISYQWFIDKIENIVNIKVNKLVFKKYNSSLDELFDFDNIDNFEYIIDYFDVGIVNISNEVEYV